MTHKVIFAPEAEHDLLLLYDYIAERSGFERAYAFTDQIHAYCLAFALFPQRGQRRDDLRPNLRIIGFRRRVTIAFHVAGGVVIIDRILYGGRDVEGIFASNDEE